VYTGKNHENIPRKKSVFFQKCSQNEYFFLTLANNSPMSRKKRLSLRTFGNNIVFFPQKFLTIFSTVWFKFPIKSPSSSFLLKHTIFTFLKHFLYRYMIKLCAIQVYISWLCNDVNITACKYSVVFGTKISHFYPLHILFSFSICLVHLFKIAIFD